MPLRVGLKAINLRANILKTKEEEMSNKIKKTPLPKKIKQPAKKLCLKHEPWYQSAHKAMSIEIRKSEETRFSMNHLPIHKISPVRDA
jgi:hypothetical protein